MPTAQILSIIKEFRALKKRRHLMDPEQYVKELQLVRSKLDAEFKKPELSNAQMKVLLKLLD